MFPNSNINKQPYYNNQNNLGTSVAQFSDNNMNQYGAKIPQQSSRKLNFGTFINVQHGENADGSTYNLGAGNVKTEQSFGVQNRPQYFRQNVPQNVQSFSLFRQDSSVQNQSFNMSAQLQNFQQRNSPNFAQNRTRNMVLNVPASDQSFQQNAPVFYGQISKENEGIKNLMSTAVQNVELTTNFVTPNVPSTSRSEIKLQQNNNNLGLLNIPKPNTQKKPDQYNAGTKEKKTEQSSASSKMMPRFGDSVMEQTFIFTGTAERVLKWGKIFENRFCLFEVISPVIQIAEGKVKFEKILLLKDKKGPVLQVTYFSNSTHVNIENFNFGQMLRKHSSDEPLVTQEETTLNEVFIVTVF